MANTESTTEELEETIDKLEETIDKLLLELSLEGLIKVAKYLK